MTRALEKVVHGATLASLFLLVFLPPMYLIANVAFKWDEIYREIFSNEILGDTYWWLTLRYLSLSFRIALVTVLIDIVSGLPLSYLLARRKLPGLGIIENLAVLPLVVPTSGFGFATLMAWTASTSLAGLLGAPLRTEYMIPVVNIPTLILLVHIALTFPYVVKTVTASLRDIEISYEVISLSLGASSLTTFRKVTFPMVAPSIFSGAVLAFARSLGETGATMIVAGVSTTAPIAIVKWELENRLAPAAFLGSILILLSFLLILPVEILTGEKRAFSYRITPLNLEDKITMFERRVEKIGYVKDLVGLALLAVGVLIPIATLIYNTAGYWSKEPYTGRFEKSIVYELFGPSRRIYSIGRAMLTSFIVASISTFISLYLSMPTMYIIVKKSYGRLLKALLKVPLVVPTSALGLSMVLLWGPGGASLLYPSIWLTILTHVVFSVPVIVEAGTAAYRALGIEFYEDAARTLGASMYDVAETVSLPLVKRSIIAGCLLAFAHSLGETGATFLVQGNDITISTLVVSLVESQAIPSALFSSSALIVAALIMLVFVRRLEK